MELPLLNDIETLSIYTALIKWIEIQSPSAIVSSVSIQVIGPSCGGNKRQMWVVN